MRGLQEAVLVTPPASSAAANDNGRPFSVALTTTSSIEFQLIAPGWWTFLATKDCHIAFYTVTAGVSAALQADWPLLAGVSKDFYVDFPVIAGPPNSYQFFKAIADTVATTSTLYWYRSSR
jgi:hypothetical protein